MATARIDLPPKLIPVFTAKGKRYRGAYGGRGSAKTRTFAKMAAVRGYQLSQAGERGLIVCGREFMNSLDESSFAEVKEAINSEPWLAAFYDIGERYIRTKDRRIDFAFLGLRHNLDSIKSKARIHLLWVDEAEPVSETAWQKTIPTVREHDSEVWVTWNPESKKSATHKRFRESQDDDMIIVSLNWRDNPWFPDVLEAERQRDKRDRPDDYDHIWEGDFKRNVEGAIYGKQLSETRQDGRITRIPVESAPVYTFWDLGRNDHTAIWFMQEIGPQKRFIDYYECRLEDLDHYIRVLKGRANPAEMRKYSISERANDRRANYNYGVHFLPHDVTVRILGMQQTRKQQLEAAGIAPIEVVPRCNDLNEAIETTRRLFASCWFDEKYCEQGLEALGHYRWKYSEDGDAYKKQPEHDWASNGADAFRQCATGYIAPSKLEINLDDLYQGGF